jgi:NTP pyrophosphatase (non-canonical NTP hydrolase)
MTLEEYETAVARTMRKPEVCLLDTISYSLGICGEGGEVAELIKKWVAHDHPLDQDKLKKELGDVLWYVTALARTHGFSLESVASKNIAKLMERYPDGFSSEASLNRKPEDK